MFRFILKVRNAFMNRPDGNFYTWYGYLPKNKINKTPIQNGKH